ncbi:MAG: LON peptidase substrate-binding domain-containing protein [Burkholderiales bacterium]|nr:LON peptidase substrate-binding domain-containing protein [Burkholderiales bacterium]
MPPLGAGGRDTAPLPLFPLKTVLYPGGILPLRIFEQRYIAMAKRCLAGDRPFGVCLLRHGDEVAVQGATPLEIATVGTLARITDWDMPELGILQVSTVGGTRFQIRRHDLRPDGLVVGEVTAIAPEPHVVLAAAHQSLANLVELLAARVKPTNFPAVRALDDASWVGYRLAEMLPLPLHVKQSMLEINDATVRLQVLQRFLVEQGLL